MHFKGQLKGKCIKINQCNSNTVDKHTVCKTNEKNAKKVIFNLCDSYNFSTKNRTKNAYKY